MQVNVSYAFRCKPWEMYLLTEGAISYSARPQICVFGKKEIVPGFLDEYCVLDAKNFSDKRYFTKFGEEVFSHDPTIKKTYVARVDTQIVFICTEEVFEALHRTAMPAIHHNASVTYFLDETSGFLTMLRVYEIDRPVDDALLTKGRQGSAVIIKLYDDQANEVSVDAVLGKPVISDGLFDYMRDEIIHIVKSKGALLGVYHNNEQGRLMLQEVGDLRRSMQPRRTYDLDATEDRAKSDYEGFYRKLAKREPQMCQLIEYIANIRPAQFGEIPVLYEATVVGDKKAYNRLIDVHLRSVLKLANTYAHLYHADIEELFQEGMHGLLLAVPRYDPQSGSTFSAYASFWEKQSMQRNVILHHNDRYVPVHMMEKLIKVSEIVDRHQCDQCVDGDDICPVLLAEVMEAVETDIEHSVLLIDLSCPSISMDEMETDDENGTVLYSPRFGTRFQPISTPFSDYGTTIAAADDRIEAAASKVVIQTALEVLTERERDVISKRYGFCGSPQTLEEIGLEFGVTRERVRQIEAKAIRKLSNPRAILTRKFGGEYKTKPIIESKSKKDRIKQKVEYSEDDRLPIQSMIALQAILQNHALAFSIGTRDKSVVRVSQNSDAEAKKLHELKEKYLFNITDCVGGWELSPISE